jgi:hypothetical protein
MSTVRLILQGKGGVGKSFIAALLAQYLALAMSRRIANMELGRSGVGVGRVFMRCFSACGSLNRGRPIIGASCRARGAARETLTE